MDTKRVKKSLTKDLEGFAAYLRKNHLKAFVIKEIRIAGTMDIPLMKQFLDFTEQQLIEMSMISSEEFLVSIENNTKFEIAKKSMELWETDKLSGISKHTIQSADLILVYALQKKALFYFLPGYTSDPQEIIAIVQELEDYYTKVQSDAIQVFIKIQNELIEAKNNAEHDAQKAVESTKLKERFLANMSHEIRTPLNAIIGFSEILSNRKFGEQEKKYVKTIKLAGENLLAIINDILDISKIEAGMMTFEEHAFSVKEIFISLNTMLIEKAKEKNLELSFRCDEDVPDVMLGDSIRLTQIIINLAGNAIKFTNKGEINVHARVLREENENTLVLMEFSVKDTGIGIQQEELEYIFERFTQATSCTTRKYGGTGLGLNIVRQLVKLQGGTLSVKSEFKVGSLFSFCIPYKKSAQTQVVSEVIEKKYNMEDLNKLNILLVEDNKLNVLLISSLFSENNLKLQVAENGSVCIDKLKETGFDIILMDMEMPVMNGYEAASIIRDEMKSNIPIIAMTAHAMTGEKERCLSFGMNDYISKPINANLLFKKMYDLTHNS